MSKEQSIRYTDKFLIYTYKGKETKIPKASVDCSCCGKQFLLCPWKFRKKSENKIVMYCSVWCARKKKPHAVPEWILINETIEKFGHDPRISGHASQNKIIRKCIWCNKISTGIARTVGPNQKGLDWSNQRFCGGSCSRAYALYKGQPIPIPYWIGGEKTLKILGTDVALLGPQSTTLVIRICARCKTEASVERRLASEVCSKCSTSWNMVRDNPIELPKHILVNDTIRETGEDPRYFLETSCRKVLVSCHWCNSKKKRTFKAALTSDACGKKCATRKKVKDSQNDPDTIRFIEEKIKPEEILLLAIIYHTGHLVSDASGRACSLRLSSKTTSRGCGFGYSKRKARNLMEKLGWEVSGQKHIQIGKYKHTQRFKYLLKINKDSKSLNKNELINKILLLVKELDKSERWSFFNELILGTTRGIEIVKSSKRRGGNPVLCVESKHLAETLKNLLNISGFSSKVQEYEKSDGGIIKKIFKVSIEIGTIIAEKMGAQKSRVGSGWKPFQIAEREFNS